jgi:tRNA (cytosine38-C5)-methyltransferase
VPSNKLDNIWRQIPGQESVWSDPRFQEHVVGTDSSPDNNIREIRDYLDIPSEGNAQKFAIPDKVLEKWGRLFDIVTPSFQRTCCFTRGMDYSMLPSITCTMKNAGYTQLVERTGSILQENEILDVGC